jgi:hypothetical protein
MLGNIPIEQQRLVYNGKALNDDEIIGKQGVASGCTILLEQMRVRISLPGNDELLIKVEPNDTICDLKTMIFEERQIPVEIQCIMFGGEELLDMKTLEECEIGHEDLLQLEEFKLLVVDSYGSSFRLSGLNPSRTIDDVKGEIFRVKHIRKLKQKLFFHGKLLDGNKSLRDEAVVHKSVFILEVDNDEKTVEEPRAKVSFMANLPNTTTRLKAPFMINVKHWNGVDTFTIESNAAEYVDDVREKIQCKHQIPVERQLLAFHGIPLRDDLNLEQQHVVDGSTLTLEPMKIFIELHDGTRPSLNVEPEYTVRQVKECLFGRGSHHLDRCLMLGALELQDGMSLEHYQIKHDEVLTVDKFMVRIMDASGVAIEVRDLTPQSTVADMKHRIMAAKYIPPEKQILSYQGERLNDNKTLVDGGIHHKSVVILEELHEKQEFPMTSKIVLGAFSATSGLVKSTSATDMNNCPKQNESLESGNFDDENSLETGQECCESAESENPVKTVPKANDRTKWWENVSKKIVQTPEVKAKSKKIKFERQKKKEHVDESLPTEKSTRNKVINAGDDDPLKKKPKKVVPRTTEGISKEASDETSPKKTIAVKNSLSSKGKKKKS